MTKINTTVANILSTLSSDAAEALRQHYRAEATAEIVAGLTGGEKPAAPRRAATAVKAETKRGQNRQHTADGRSASQFIRDCGEELSAKDVVEAASKVGLTIEASLVYNVRAQAKKKAEEAENEAEAEKKDEARKEQLRKNAEKARAARQAKIAEKKNAEKNAEVTEEKTPAAPETNASETEETPAPEVEAPKAKKSKKPAAAE